MVWCICVFNFYVLVCVGFGSVVYVTFASMCTVYVCVVYVCTPCVTYNKYCQANKSEQWKSYWQLSISQQYIQPRYMTANTLFSMSTLEAFCRQFLLLLSWYYPLFVYTLLFPYFLVLLSNPSSLSLCSLWIILEEDIILQGLLLSAIWQIYWEELR